jgi:hypothetical protein
LLLVYNYVNCTQCYNARAGLRKSSASRTSTSL